MSFINKIKAMFSGGGDAHDNDRAHAGHDHAGHDHASHEHEDLASTPADPLGTPMPGAPPADRDERL